MILQDVVYYIIQRRPGITDRQLTEAIFGNDRRHADINQECRLLEGKGVVERRKIGDEPIRNFHR